MKYTQKWRQYKGAVRHMMRFYLYAQDAKAEELSTASGTCWRCCDVAYKSLPEGQQNIVKTYFTLRWDDSETLTPIKMTAAMYGIQDTDVMRVVNKLIRDVAIRRGLADE